MASLPEPRSGAQSWLWQQPVLPNFRRQRSRLEILVKRGAFLAFCILTGLFYGLAFTLLPPQIFMYLGAPILLLALLIIWALPDVGRGPVRLLSGLFFLYLVVLILWPNYLALQLPGLPWISFRRLVAFPFAFIFLICLSVSHRFRDELSDVLRTAKPLTYMMIAFTIVQFVTIFLSPSITSSLNSTINHWFGTTALFFAAAWVLAQPGKAEKFINWSLATAFILCLIGVVEAYMQKVIWADYIPSFLQVGDEAVARILEGKLRDGRYRVTTTFSVSLSLAEYLALITPFVLHRLLRSTRVERMLVWAAFDVVLLAIIYSTQSRLGILGWIIAHAFYGCVWGFRRWSRSRSDIIGPAISLFYSVGAALFIIGMFTVPAIRNRTIGGGSSGFSDQSRIDQFAMMWPKLFQNPIGYGAGSSGEVLGYRSPGGLLTVDSYVITTLLDHGVIGFALYFGMLIYGGVKLTRIAFRSHDDHMNLALPIATALLVVFQVKLVLSQPDNHPFIAMLLGLAAVIIWRHERSERERASTSPA